MERSNSNLNIPTGPRFDLSRDPRRTPQNKTPDVQGTVAILNQLTAEITELTHINLARKRIIKRRQAEEQSLKIAYERAFTYPSYIQGLKLAREESDKELKMLNELVNTHNTNKEKIILSLAHAIHSAPNQEAHSDHVVGKLEREQDDLWHQSDKYRSSIAGLSSRVNDICQRLDTLRDDVDSLSKMIKRNNTDTPPVNKPQINKDDVDLRFSELSSDFEALKSTYESANKNRDDILQSIDKRVKDTMTSLATTKAAQLNNARQSEERLQSALRPLSEQTSALKSTMAASAQKIDKIESQLSNLESTMDSTVKEMIPSLQTQVDESTKAIQLHIERPSESSKTPSQLPPDKTQENLKEDLRLLSQQLNNFQKAHEGKLETLSKAVDDANQEVSRTKGVDFQSIEQKYTQLHNQLAGHVNALYGHLTGTHTALNSLETRYGQLVTEPVIRQIVLRMQEMYPYASKAQAEIECLINAANDHLAHITSQGTRITSLEEGLAKLKKADESLITFLRSERAEITGRVDAVQAKINELENSTVDTFANLTADVKLTTEKIEEIKPQFQTTSNGGPSAQILSEMSVSSIPSDSQPASQSSTEQHRNKKRKLDEETPKQ
ncbi:hypothetical protein H112_04401 [Trichophyton rubrum D6]|uniref:Paramyosin n=3 Tax=Trichophyton rubrum TaxID=5551 RepID=A0A178F2K1_TRIRU|nr:uncharacterized protein TERG_04173 [Trichophyton rubrum CBS 118892]EZF22920.1 hypothetical protein H100_04410 [Trichophyton rubrum MR850]EZF41859.1 hypothetical protein H102_04394 [Trichophyton rubrum CBS 100081]EZF52531.1 hypothetical protein H103_04403 [Trichophyton rubrum CBS 288.86]EZF63021.1 hypothetical protein H104_04392 [Trichophyton rubrum CBS 289.86]EZF84443.1 hypothetical protein H110_04396 [Trichophyton rubrum MR1448]EZF95121.1 hypothetical protein H113_04437 [Trichophyton rubr